VITLRFDKRVFTFASGVVRYSVDFLEVFAQQHEVAPPLIDGEIGNTSFRIDLEDLIEMGVCEVRRSQGYIPNTQMMADVCIVFMRRVSLGPPQHMNCRSALP
jgi:hypothetical protein